MSKASPHLINIRYHHIKLSVGNSKLNILVSFIYEINIQFYPLKKNVISEKHYGIPGLSMLSITWKPFGAWFLPI